MYALNIWDGEHFQEYGVLNLEDGKYYAMKTIFPKYYEDSLHEIEINKIIHNPVNGKYVIRMIDNFVSKEKRNVYNNRIIVPHLMIYLKNKMKILKVFLMKKI